MRQGFIPRQRLSGGIAGIVIEDDVWIGANCTVHEGVHIKQGAVVTAGSIIKGILDDYGIYAGTPLKCVGYRR
jgi:acetyltransferase-like isoleucine patch superfamily enzyme